jgi:hypothetical protein
MTLIGKPRWNNAILAYLVPPREDMPFQSPRILIFTRHHVEINHQEGYALPGYITEDKEIMRRELCDPEHLPCILVQLDEDNQFMYFIMDDTPPEAHKILNARVDEVEDKASVPGYNAASPPSPIILPGAANPPSPGLGGGLILPGQNATGYSGDVIYRVELDWTIEPLDNPDLLDVIRKTAVGANVI